MENASKALIIAGAILISIVLIVIGVNVLNGSTGVTDEAGAQMDDMQKQSFNSKFTSYEGTKRGSAVKTLISTVIATNTRAAQDGTPEVKIVFKENGEDSTGGSTGGKEEGKTKTEDLDDIRQRIKDNGSYKISITTNGNTALVDTITIEKNK